MERIMDFCEKMANQAETEAERTSDEGVKSFNLGMLFAFATVAHMTWKLMGETDAEGQCNGECEQRTD